MGEKCQMPFGLISTGISISQTPEVIASNRSTLLEFFAVFRVPQLRKIIDKLEEMIQKRATNYQSLIIGFFYFSLSKLSPMPATGLKNSRGKYNLHGVYTSMSDLA